MMGATLAALLPLLGLLAILYAALHWLTDGLQWPGDG
jgi:hypothetical protein